MNPVEAEMLLLLKPLIAKAIQTYVIPEISKLEGQISNAALKDLITNITTSVENIGLAALAAA